MLERYSTAIYVICVKPQVFEEVVSSWPVNSRPEFIISVMAGVPLKVLNAKVITISSYKIILEIIICCT